MNFVCPSLINTNDTLTPPKREVEEKNNQITTNSVVTTTRAAAAAAAASEQKYCSSKRSYTKVNRMCTAYSAKKSEDDENRTIQLNAEDVH